jgi:hypothetical protein
LTLRLVLDQYEIVRNDYGYDINFKLYEEDGATPFNATGYSGVIKSFKRHGDRTFFFRDVERAISVLGQVGTIIDDIDVTWVTQSSGIGKFQFTNTKKPSLTGFLWLEVQLTKSGAKRSSELVRIFITPSQ